MEIRAQNSAKSKMTELRFVAVCLAQRRQGIHLQKCWTFLFSRIPYLFSLLSPTSAQVSGSAYHMFILWSVLIAVCEFVNKFLVFLGGGDWN